MSSRRRNSIVCDAEIRTKVITTNPCNVEDRAFEGRIYGPEKTRKNKSRMKVLDKQPETKIKRRRIE